MQRLLAYFRARPKTAIVSLLALTFAAIMIWNATGPKGFSSTSYGGGTSSSVVPLMPGRESVGAVSANADYYYDESGMPSKMAPDVGIMPPMPMPAPTAGENAAETDQKIIKNGYLQLTVDKVTDAADKITQLVEVRGGFVESSSVSERGDGTYSGNVSVRVPVQKYEETMREIKKLATLVKSETSTGQDVTEQYSDLEAQLRNARAQEETYLEILKQARTVDDTLKVQYQLGIIRGQIESLQGRIKYLGNATSYSTISVSLEEEPVVRAPTKEFRFMTIVKQAVQVLVAAVQNIVTGLIWTVIVWGGVLLPIGLLVWIAMKIWKRRGAAPTQKR